MLQFPTYQLLNFRSKAQLTSPLVATIAARPHRVVTIVPRVRRIIRPIPRLRRVIRPIVRWGGVIRPASAIDCIDILLDLRLVVQTVSPYAATAPLAMLATALCAAEVDSDVGVAVLVGETVVAAQPGALLAIGALLPALNNAFRVGARGLWRIDVHCVGFRIRMCGGA
jgi:hypothetical protein